MKARKIIIGIAAAAFLLTGICPPWRVISKDGRGHIKSTRVEFSELWDTPYVPYREYGGHDIRIAVDVLAVEWLLVAGLAAAAWFVFVPSNRG